MEESRAQCWKCWQACEQPQLPCSATWQNRLPSKTGVRRLHAATVETSASSLQDTTIAAAAASSDYRPAVA